MIKVEIIPVLNDNYTYVLIAANGDVAIVDPGEAEPVIDYLEAHSLTPDLILNTHHHGDHIAGNAKIIQHYGCQLAGPKSEIARITGMNILLDETSEFFFGAERVQIIETPGHTSGHICFYFAESGALFSGDTLFSMGCGRLFEGSAEDMFTSFKKLKALPEDTLVYCGHEYTLSNAKFCLSVEPDNEALKMRIKEVEALRISGKPSLPVSLKVEKETNVFMRANSAGEFGALRSAKDNF